MSVPRVVLLAALSAFGLGGSVLGAAGCVDRTIRCEDATDCVRAGNQGMCLEPGLCAFSDPDCATGQRWDETAGARGGSCVDDGSEKNACGGHTVLPGDVGGSCGVCGTGSLVCDGLDTLACTGEASIGEPLVSPSDRTGASSVYMNDIASYGSGLAIDGDATTSWLSDGPEPGGETTFTWLGEAIDCIGQVEITGNGQNATFSTDHGFESVTVEVLDGSGLVAFSQEVDLTGTPDPPQTITVGVLGMDIRLVFEGPENPDTGGFAELQIYGLR